MQTTKMEQEFTRFMNKTSFTAEEIERFPYDLRKTYIAEWYDTPDVEPLRFYATDDDTAKWYLSEYYNTMPDYLVEQITDFREVSLA